jgi:hypothetical protein
MSRRTRQNVSVRTKGNKTVRKTTTVTVTTKPRKRK